MHSLWDIHIFLGLVPKESPCSSSSIRYNVFKNLCLVTSLNWTRSFPYTDWHPISVRYALTSTRLYLDLPSDFCSWYFLSLSSVLPDPLFLCSYQHLTSFLHCSVNYIFRNMFFRLYTCVSTWWLSNGTTEMRCRKRTKWTYSVQVLFLSGYKIDINYLPASHVLKLLIKIWYRFRKQSFNYLMVYFCSWCSWAP